MSLKPNIKHVIAIIQKAVGQTPLDKQPLLNNKIARVIDKFQKSSNSDEPSFLRQLQFNLNFIKLSFPHLDFSPPVQQPDAQAIASQVEDIRAREEFIELENKEQVQKFVKETEEILKGVRREVEFSNWSAGNIDPEDLRRHQELLKRQYFSGEFWKDKEKPMSPSAAYLMNLMENQSGEQQERVVLQDKPAQFSHDPDQSWQKVKR